MSEITPNTQQQILEVCKMCYREYAEHMGWDSEQMANEGRISDFVVWCRQEQLPKRDKYAFVQVGIPEEVIDLVWDHVFDSDDFSACATLIPMWSAICMSGRPPMKHRPIMSSIGFTIRFEDKRVINIQTPTRFDPEHPRTEGFIISLLEEQFRQIIHACKSNGLAVLLEKHGQYVPDPTPEEIAEFERQQKAGQTTPMTSLPPEQKKD